MSLTKLAVSGKSIAALLAALGLGAAGGGYIAYGYGKKQGGKEVISQIDAMLRGRRAMAMGDQRLYRNRVNPGYGRGLAMGPRDGSGIGRYGFCKDGTPCE